MRAINEDIETIKKVIEPIKQYVSYNFSNPRYNKHLTLNPAPSLEAKLTLAEREKYRACTLEKFREKITEFKKIADENIKIMSDIYQDKKPVDALYLIAMLSGAKEETRQHIYI